MNASELAAFWKDFNRLYNENGQLYHRVARFCGLSDCALFRSSRFAISAI